MFGILPNNLYIAHAGSEGTGTSDNSHQLSPRIWNKVLAGGMATDHKNSGRFIADDFLNAGTVSAAASTDFAGGYGLYAGTGDSVTPSVTDTNGVLALSTAATDNNEVWIASGGGTGVLGSIPADSGTGTKMAFECRFSVSSVSDVAYFVGLAATGQPANNGKADNSGAMRDAAYLGFDSVTASPTNMSFSNRKASGSEEDIVASAVTLAASTWVKAGFVYDPQAPTSKRIKVYVNNIEQTSYGTHSHIADATNFPGGVALAFAAGVKTGATAAATLNLDWWAFYQADN